MFTLLRRVDARCAITGVRAARRLDSFDLATRSDLDSKEIHDRVDWQRSFPANAPPRTRATCRGAPRKSYSARRYATDVRDDNADRAAKRRLR